MDQIAHLWRHAPAWKLSLFAVIGISLAFWIFPPATGPKPVKPGTVQTAPAHQTQSWNRTPAPVPATQTQTSQVQSQSPSQGQGQWQRVDPPAQGKTREETARETQERMQKLFRDMDTLKPKEQGKP